VFASLRVIEGLLLFPRFFLRVESSEDVSITTNDDPFIPLPMYVVGHDASTSGGVQVEIYPYFQKSQGGIKKRGPVGGSASGPGEKLRR